MLLRFSDHNKLGKSQAELDFVDVPLDTDIPLFVDPYALSLEDDPWFVECNNMVVDYFQLVVDAIRMGDRRVALQLLGNLHEPNDTHLGYSGGRPAGRGIGSDQATDLYQRLTKSKAVQSGKLSDLADCELLIPGISSDKISDMTINIVRGKLIDYTEAQCSLLGIRTQRVQGGVHWRADTRRWANRYANLPVYQGQQVLLVPKAAVRYRMAEDHREYYQHFVLEYLQAEHLEAGSALVTVLQNGKRVVYKKDLKEEFPCSKDYLFHFSEEHPEVLERYKKSLAGKTGVLMDEQLEDAQPEPREVDILALKEELAQIPAGNEAAADYHQFIIGAIESIFYPALRNPRKEAEINEGRKRVDVVYNNGAESGFFHDIIFRHGVHCPYVFVECKNYTGDPKNPELDQLIGRFGPKRGMLGILVCRRVTDRDTMVRRCRDIVQNDRGFVVVFDDDDINTLLELRAARDHLGISDYLDGKFRRLVM